MAKRGFKQWLSRGQSKDNTQSTKVDLTTDSAPAVTPGPAVTPVPVGTPAPVATAAPAVNPAPVATPASVATPAPVATSMPLLEPMPQTGAAAAVAAVTAAAPSTPAIQPPRQPSSAIYAIRGQAKAKTDAMRDSPQDRDVYSELKMKAGETKEKAKDKAIVVFNEVKSASLAGKDRTLMLVRDPQFQTCTVTTAGGAITLGAVGGTFGLASGVVVGSAVGVVPALFTFGLSIPAGAVIGGTGGLCTGMLIGGTSGGAAGLTAYKYRIQIKNGMMTIQVKMHDLLGSAKATMIKAYKGANAAVSTRALKLQVSINTIASKAKENSLFIASKAKNNSVIAVQLAKTKASEAHEFATTTKVGVTSSSAVAGAVVGGATTGAFGTVAGAAVGIIPAFFTFGLSIPAGAVIGLCAGTAVGGSAGAVGGGAIGYTSFTHGKAIKETVRSSLSKVSTKATELKATSFTRAAEATESVKSMVRASTGGSDKTDNSD